MMRIERLNMAEHNGFFMDERPVAIDLFCGGGGFSEGLEQAGFEVTHAMDIDNGACETYRLNHPETEVIKADIMEVEPEEFPSDIDLLFGSPPCTEFSWAKSGGGGDIEEGMKLVKRFLYFVVELEPDYWIMENVPRLDNYLPSEIDLADIPWTEKEGSLEIGKHILESDDYGAPQRRKRLFSGVFSVPDHSDDEAPTFGEIRENFPRPTDGATPGETVSDPVYDLELDEADLTDHFYISHVTNREAKEIRVRKEDHSFYGTMSFPDDPTVPSRTVLATNRRVARETLVMEEPTAPEGLSRFRKPTIREIASIQGFPITYQFTGGSQAQKWRRVGDAVAVPVSFAIGQAIRAEMGLEVPEEPDVATECPPIETNLNDRDTSWKGRRSLSISRNFRHHIPLDNKNSFRVDVETDKESQPTSPLSQLIDEDVSHPVEFEVTLYRGYSTDVESTSIDFETALRYMDELLTQHPDLEEEVERILTGFLTELGPRTPDATTLQAIRSRRHERDESLEYELLETISDYDGGGIVDAELPQSEFGRDVAVDLPDLLSGGTQLPVRVVLKLVGGNYLAWKLNHCSKWMRDHPDEVYLQEGLDGVDDFSALTCESDGTHRCVDEHLQSLIAVDIKGSQAEPAQTG